MRNTISDIMYLNMYFTKNKTLTRFIICMCFFMYIIYIYFGLKKKQQRVKRTFILIWCHDVIRLRCCVCCGSAEEMFVFIHLKCLNRYDAFSVLIVFTGDVTLIHYYSVKHCSSLSNIKEHCFVWIKRINTLVTEKCISFRSLCPELAPCRVLMRNSF